jgi:hypothetical protein
MSTTCSPRKNFLTHKTGGKSLPLGSKNIREVFQDERQEKIQRAIETLERFDLPTLSAKKIKESINFGRKY